MTAIALTKKPAPNVWEKIGYSLAGLVAGNLVNILLLFATRLLPAFAAAFHFNRNPVSASYAQLAWLAIPIAIVSLAGWLVVGIPVVLLIPVRCFLSLPLAVFVPIGACLGLLAYALMMLMFDGGRLNLNEMRDSIYFLLLAAAISSSALTVVALLIRHKRGASADAPLLSL